MEELINMFSSLPTWSNNNKVKCKTPSDSGVRAPLDLGGGGDLIARKKLRDARKHVLYKRAKIAVKTKTLPILTSNGRIIIPKLQLRISEGNENWFEKWDISRNLG